MCPECGSDDIAVRQYDFGKDPETGYRDAGEVATCRGCGNTGHLDDFEVKESGRPKADEQRGNS